MPTHSQPAPVPSRGRMLLGLIVAILTVLAVWAVIEYRTQPPDPPPLTAPL